MTIKGASGPFVVIGSNFAPGTTAADIQSAIEPISGPMLTCRVTSHHPTVTAEFAFGEKWCAENAVANFHNQRVSGQQVTDSQYIYSDTSYRPTEDFCRSSYSQLEPK
jgi:hypothetical protein